MTDDELHQLAGAYALDALDQDERAAFETHLPHCASCTAAVAEFGLTAAELGEVAHLQPPASLKAAVMAAVANTAQVPATTAPVPATTSAPAVDELARRRRPPAVMLALAAAAVVVIAGVLSVFALTGTDTTDELIAAPDAVTLQLDPTVDEFANASIEVVWSQEQARALVRASGLPDPGEGNAYELWFLVADGVAPAGLFLPENGAANVILELDDVEGVGWGVTIEPETGSDQPTSDVLFAGLA